VTETIVAAAIRIPVSPARRLDMWQGRRVYPDFLIVSSPPPARHGTLMHGGDFRASPGDQGFLTSSGRYVDREEGFTIASAAGQIIHKSGNPDTPTLYSEDMW
jgi:hypothetical protein